MSSFFDGITHADVKALVEHSKRAKPRPKDWSQLQDVQSKADMLRTCFASVVINGSDEHPIIRAKDHNKWPARHACKHRNLNLAKNVRVWINADGYLSTNKEGVSFFQSRVLYCADCDYVIAKGGAR